MTETYAILKKPVPVKKDLRKVCFVLTDGFHFVHIVALDYFIEFGIELV